MKSAIPLNSEELFDAIMRSDNPTQLLSDFFDRASSEEDVILRYCIGELLKEGLVSVPLWADDKPYLVIIRNVAKPNETPSLESEERKNARSNSSCDIGFDGIHSVTIGSGNVIYNSTIAGIAKNDRGLPPDARSSFYARHPVICGLLISLAAGVILLLPFWANIADFLEEVF